MAGLRLTWAAHGAHVQRCGEITSIHKCDNLCRNLARSLLIQARGKTRRGASCLKANEIIVLRLLSGREDTSCSPDGPCDHIGPVTRVHLPSGCSHSLLSREARQVVEGASCAGASGATGELMVWRLWMRCVHMQTAHTRVQAHPLGTPTDHFPHRTHRRVPVCLCTAARTLRTHGTPTCKDLLPL